MPDVMRLASEKRMADALHVGARTLVCAQKAEYEALKALKIKGVDVVTVEEVVLPSKPHRPSRNVKSTC